MRVQAIDHVALLPLYLAAGAAVLALFGGRFAKACMMIGLSTAAIAAAWVGGGEDRATFAVGDWHSFAADDAAMGAAVVFAGLSVLVAALSGRQTGEYWFLLAVSAAGGITLAGARDLITLIVALETLTVPLYALVTWPSSQASPKEPGRDGAEAGVTFLIASITSSATALMGAALLYSAAGTVHLEGLAAGLDGAEPGLVAAGVALLLGGLAFKLAAAPLHAWAPLVLERAPLPIATYLASASKLGGAVAIVWVVHFGLGAIAGTSTGIVVAALSVASIVIGNLGALVQRRTVPLLAWSGIAHAGYTLAPLAVIATAAGQADAAAAASAALAYAVFFVLLEAGAFAALTAVRSGAALAATGPETRAPLADMERRPLPGALQSEDPGLGEAGEPSIGGGSDVKASAGAAGVHISGGEGGSIAELAGLWRAAPLPASLFLFSVIGLAGLPPALAGTFAKVAVLEVLASSAVWLAVIVAAGAVLGLAYYLPLARTVLLGPAPAGRAAGKGRFAIALAAIGLALLAVTLAPQLVLDFTAVSR
ncbi:NADH-quinone oxidoreductase subunit N [Glycomyces tritici]|uniref:Proton-conducting transporter membrane subunit n=1 Tax=Glycomyces tritici TaxID=2665176 RepID=A0ABT7YP60_9ACTN|nr:proton-conducting transporter membrane subunit [Glycomyces tritici]MDN3240398.1 proton-conducting transporter membrane subunit [Glycomyces tritici]